MFALAVLLLVAAAALVLWVLFGLNGENNNDVHFHGFGIDANLSPLTVFLLGALTLLLIWAATRLIAAGTKRKYRQHKETKELRKEHEHSEAERREIERERDRLAAERAAAQRGNGPVAADRVDDHRAGERDVIGNRVDGRVDERATDVRRHH